MDITLHILIMLVCGCVVQGNMSDVWQALAPVEGLAALRLVNDSGLAGVLASTSVAQGSICGLVSAPALILLLKKRSHDSLLVVCHTASCCTHAS